jgi:hypothetical protein
MPLRLTVARAQTTAYGGDCGCVHGGGANGLGFRPHRKPPPTTHTTRTMPREWEPPSRAPWNNLIRESLAAIDRHEHLLRTTGDGFHARAAHQLRGYVAELKDWITAQET